jgi:hypothetical protein
VYHRQTRPIVEFYAGRSTFRSIDGNQPPDIVTAAMEIAVREASLVQSVGPVVPGKGVRL